MKLSARNTLPGEVTLVKKGVTTAQVKIEIAPQLSITSVITNESVDDLALAPGDKVTVIVKSSDVIIGK